MATWDELKRVMEASEKGERILIPVGTFMTFRGTLDVKEGQHFELMSEGAVFDGFNDWGSVRLFYVRGSLSLSGLSFNNGKTDYGGAIYFDYGSQGNLTNCRFRNNLATYMGGAMLSKGAHLTLSNVDFKGNRAHNTCLDPKHCSRRRRNGRRANAMYILSHSKIEMSLRKQPKNQDIFFDRDYDGMATFHCARPRISATAPHVAKHHVHYSKICNLSSTAGLAEMS